jgi:hypothetical protein
MSLWERLFKGEREEESQASLDNGAGEDSSLAGAHDEYIPGTIDLGWYYSESKDELQMAKIAGKDRGTHFYVIGATGTGKTKFIEFLIQQDIENGNGFGVIDPHGDLIEDIKGFLACRYHHYKDEKEVSERVILIDPTDPKYTVTFNPLEKLPNVSVAEQAAELVSSFRKIWSDSWGVRMEDLMRNSMIALGEAGLALSNLPQFLTRRAYREGVLERVSHPISREYFQRFDVLTDRGQASWIEPVMNKINAFLSDDRIRQMFFSPKSSFNLREVIDGKRILLIKLDKGKLKDSADLLGSLLMAKIQMAAFSRSDIPQSKRTPFYLYIDEFQNFASESFSVILSEARKYGLSLIMAHQTLAQISPELRGMILGNSGVQVYFRINRQDATLLAKEAFEYSGYEVKTLKNLHPVFWSLGEEWENYTEELQNLPPRACYVKHKIQGGLIPLQTAEIEPAWEIMGMHEDEYADFIAGVPFGIKYLVERQELTRKLPQRELVVDEAIQTVSKGVSPTTAATEEQEGIATGETQTTVPEPEGSGWTRHRKLQNTIKNTAEKKGYQVVIEQPTPDGLGRIDVALEKDGNKIACEVSVTSSSEYELANIEKCLVAGYNTVILCSPNKKNLNKIKSFVLRRLKSSDKEKVLFLQPEELALYLEEETGKKEWETETDAAITSDELWQERIWDALKHLDDRSELNTSPLARLAYIQRLAERKYKGNILVSGLALRHVLIDCIDRIVEAGKQEPGLEKTCEFLSMVKEGSNITEIGNALGLSRERVAKHYKKKAVELVTDEFLNVVKTRKTGASHST